MVVSAQTVCGLGSIASQGSPQGSQDPRGRTSRAAVRSPLERGPRRWRIRPRSKERNQARVGTKLAAASLRATSRRRPSGRPPKGRPRRSPPRRRPGRLSQGYSWAPSLLLAQAKGPGTRLVIGGASRPKRLGRLAVARARGTNPLRHGDWGRLGARARRRAPRILEAGDGARPRVGGREGDRRPAPEPRPNNDTKP